MKEFIGLAVVFWVFVFVVVGGAIYYFKRRGVLRAAANAATQAVKQDVQDAADKIVK